MDCHGLLLGALQEAGEAQGEEFLAVLQNYHLGNAAGLWALMRLAGASASIAVLRWVMEDWPQGSAVGGPLTRDEVLDEVRSSQWWCQYE